MPTFLMCKTHRFIPFTMARPKRPQLLTTLPLLFLIELVRPESPQLSPHCPEEVQGLASIRMTSDIPAFALAKCGNGEHPFLSRDNKDYYLLGILKRSNEDQECQFIERGEGHLFTLDVEVRWGEAGQQTITHRRVHTISCMYDSRGKAISFSQSFTDSRVDLPAANGLVPHMERPVFEISVLDIGNEDILTDSIYLGKQIRLRAIDRSNTIRAFRAISCVAKNAVTSYAILKGGCGDGTILPKNVGFLTAGREVYSPFFPAFQLKGGDTVQFLCNFTECGDKCDGDSCLEEIRRRQALSPEEREREDSACNMADPGVLVMSADEDEDNRPIFGQRII